MQVVPKWERGEFESSAENSGWEKKPRREQQTLVLRTIATTKVVLQASRSVSIPRSVLERRSARATDNWSQIYLAETKRDDELHGVNLMESWTDIEKLVDIFCLEFFPEKAHDLYCSICNHQLNGKTAASVMSHQSDSKRCRYMYIQRNNLQTVKNSFFYWSDSVEIDESMLDVRGDILSVFKRYVFTDTETKHQKRRLQCLKWLVYILRGRTRTKTKHEEKLAALFDETYRKRQMRIALNETAEKKICDVSRRGVLSRINRLQRLLSAMEYMDEWKTTLHNEELLSNDLVHEEMRLHTKPPWPSGFNLSNDLVAEEMRLHTKPPGPPGVWYYS